MYVLGMFCVTLVLAEFQHNCFHADSRYDNILPNGGVLSTFDVSSLPECAQECFDQFGCISVFYKDGQCVGWDTRMDDMFPTTVSESVRYYELKGKYGNVAEGKSAVQSSTFPSWSGIYQAFQAVDGSRYPVAVKPDDSCSCTASAALEWWQVDLLETYLVTDVAVLQREDDPSGGTNLTNVSISVAQVSGGPFTECYNTGPTLSTTRFETFKCQIPVYGRYVKIMKLVKVNFCMCEVEIYVLA